MSTDIQCLSDLSEWVGWIYGVKTNPADFTKKEYTSANSAICKTKVKYFSLKSHITPYYA